MRYLFAVIASTTGPIPAGPEEIAAIDTFNEKIQSAGQRILAVGIAEPSSAVVFDNRSGAGLITHSPVVESDEFVAGLWIIQAESESVAHQLAAEASFACNRRIEVRPLLS
jgi:hypothetical protein